MRFRNSIAILLAMVLMVALAACGGSTSSSEAVSEVESEVSESEAVVESEEEEVDENNPYGLDYEATGYQDMMKEGLLPEADLREAFEELEANAIDVMTYDEVVELIGIDPQEIGRAHV